MRRTLPAWGVGVVVVAAALATGCAEESNRNPTLLPIDDAVFKVNQSGTIEVRAGDPDQDQLTYDFVIDPAPVTQTAGTGGRPRLTEVSNELAIFTWTPGVAETGGERSKAFTVTFTVKDGRGGQASESIQLRVEDDGVSSGGGLRFGAPPGAGMAVDLGQTECVDQLAVEVKSEAYAADQIELTMTPPPAARCGEPGAPNDCRAPTLVVPPGTKTGFFDWCPTEAQLDLSLSHTVVFTARVKGSDQEISKRFTIRFKRTAGAGCAGEPPVIEHTEPGSFSGPLNYPIEATIRDDVGFKAPPVLAFTVDPGVEPAPTSPDTSGWQLVEFAPGQGDRWTASVPNLNLPPGDSAQVYYVIIATDNDDPDSTRCDHTTESRTFRFTATGGAGGGSTYGLCAPCVADQQCGGPADRCVNLRGEGFCGVSCENTDCGPGQLCLELESISDGTTSLQCMPQDLNCGQICADDAYEAGTRNDTAQAAAPLEVGTHEGLTLCDGDEDYFAVPVEARQSITVRAVFADARGDLDLAMALPGDADFAYQSLNGGVDVEQVTEPCVPQAGEAVIVVFPFEGAQNQYTLEIEAGPGQCDQMCQDDRYDQGDGNDTLDDATLYDAEDLPLTEEGLFICREDADFFGFEARAGQIITAGIAFRHRDGDLDLRLYRVSDEAVVAESLSYRDAEMVQVEAAVDDVYIVEVFGATRSVSNAYGLLLEVDQVQMCQSTMECAAGQYCSARGCIEDTCGGFGDCEGAHGCVTPRAGLDPATSGGSCAARCQADRDCRAGNACKRFEDFSRGCGVAGAAGPGRRCASYRDCSGEQVCFATPGGYCAAGGCAGAGDCPMGTICGTLDGFDACLKACQGDGDCRVAEGYRCKPVAGGMACLP